MLDCLKHDCVPALKNLEAHMTWHIFASSVIGIEMNKKLQILDSLTESGWKIDEVRNSSKKKKGVVVKKGSRHQTMQNECFIVLCWWYPSLMSGKMQERDAHFKMIRIYFQCIWQTLHSCWWSYIGVVEKNQCIHYTVSFIRLCDRRIAYIICRAYMKIHLWLQNTFECVAFVLYGVLWGGKTTAIDGASHLCLSMKKMRKSCMLNALRINSSLRPAGLCGKKLLRGWNGAEVFWCANYRLGEILQHFAFKEATRPLSDSIGH